MSDDDVVSFDQCRAIAETDAAILVDIPGHGKVWIPKSQVDDDSEVYEDGTDGTLVITEWMAIEKGLV